MTEPESGHRSLPHTADLRIEAWGPTRQACLGEAVAAMVESFADVSTARPVRTATADLTASDDEDALVSVLDEVIYLLDTENVVALGAEVEHLRDTLRVRVPVAPLDELDLFGAVPKAVSLHGLDFSAHGRLWRCTATVDV